MLTLLHMTKIGENKSVKERDVTEIKGTVVLQHGATMDGLSWFNTEHESLPSLLIGAGYDVFLGNTRGTKNSQRHKELSPLHDAHKFFDYSLKEMGQYDAMANMNLAKEKSSGLPVIYIGYAEAGTAILHALGSEANDDKLIIRALASEVILLAPCVSLSVPEVT